MFCIKFLWFFFVHMCQKNLRFINLVLKRLKMGIQSTLEEVNFDNADMAALKNPSQDAVKSRWDDVACPWCECFFYSRLVVHPKEEARVRASVEVVKVKEGKQDICTCIFVSFCICICIRWKRARRRCPPGSLTSRWSWRGGVWGTSGDSPSSTGWCHLIGGWWHTYADTFYKVHWTLNNVTGWVRGEG